MWHPQVFLFQTIHTHNSGLLEEIIAVVLRSGFLRGGSHKMDKDSMGNSAVVVLVFVEHVLAALT